MTDPNAIARELTARRVALGLVIVWSALLLPAAIVIARACGGAP